MSIALFKGTREGLQKVTKVVVQRLGSGEERPKTDRHKTHTQTNQPTRSPRRVGISWVAVHTQEGKETLSEGQTTKQ